MPVRDTIDAGLDTIDDKVRADEAHRWLQRLEVLLQWIARNPRLAEVRHEAARLLVDFSGSDPIALEPKRRV